uniref:Phenylalanine--tRNA ligase beta subunit n=1 Tax=Syphacia muris TaxID=451379 RepID=A0A0N5AYP4_9BILA
MPTIGIRKAVIDKNFGKTFTEKEFDELCFDYGLELDEVTSEKCAVRKEKGEKMAEGLSEEEVYKIELPANRYDLLAIEGFARALKIFHSQLEQPRYTVKEVERKERINVLETVHNIRPFIVAAILRDVTLDSDAYASLIDLQDKLHQNICRKRTLVAIGTHDYDTIKGPFTYGAEKPESIYFKPLNQTREYTATELMNLYSDDSHLKAYLPIISDKERYPVVRDSNNVVCSMPPIINGEHSKIHLETKNIFIECTAVDLQKAIIVLDTVVAIFSQYCKQPFTVEPVEVKQIDGSVIVYPELKYRQHKVSVKNINTKIGLNLTGEEMAHLLSRMSLSTEVLDDSSLLVTIPPTRHDVLHECDIAEDVAIAYGYNNIQQRFPDVQTVAETFLLNKFSDLLREEIANAGWTEILNFALCSAADISTKLLKDNALKEAVKIANPKSSDFQVVRTSLLPGLLRTLASNRDMPLPLKLFELQDVVLKDSSAEVGARNERRLAAVHCSTTAGFEIIHGFLDYVMQMIGLKWSAKNDGYHIEGYNDCFVVIDYVFTNETLITDPTFFFGRCARVIGPKGVNLGTIGVVHPDVISAFGFALPVSALEITIEPFVALIRAMYADSLLIIFIAICTAILGELLTYVLVYRSDQYKRLKCEMERKTKKLERKGLNKMTTAKKIFFLNNDSKLNRSQLHMLQKEMTTEGDRTGKKKIEREEERLKATNRDMSMFKMKSMFAIGFAFTALLSTFSSIFDGRTVAKLPFTPISFIQGLSHRNLIGDDYTDCSFIFLYILCTMTIRQNLQKMLGFAPSRAMNRQVPPSFFGTPSSSLQNNFSYLR